MSLIVQKFGGTSVANADRVRNVARIVTDTYRQGHDVIVVVSAQGDTTDDLIEKANEINPKASKREMDMLLAAGEEISISLLAMAIESLGFPVVSMLGWQAGFQTTSVNGNARIKRIDTDRLREALDKRNIVVVAGFQGINRFGDISTLGRGGSDTSAVALAAALQAECCQIYTDVDGVYTADPRKVKNARKLEEITYDEMLELATLGAQVLHNRSVEMAKKYNVDLEVRSSLDPVEGTKVKEVVNVEKMLIKGVTRDNNIARISIVGVKDQPGIAFKIFSRLAGAQVNVDIILQSIGRDGTKDIAFTVPQSQGEAAMNAIKDMAEIVGCKHVHYHDNVSKVSVVGAGMESNPGVAARMFEALYDADINIQMISTSEIKISVIINRDMADRAVAAIHDAFIS
ncbi:aspartate kinase [Solibaculum mannosilyticum]|uniref:Aspartokinase n=1 Tax=Solibaculum mannosilyticum TaxID=2780922 RepID=A0A7I8D1I8_9FIRM|nr:aspartate kinase [Solibaculum mannosilyticum]MCO7137014.1 aspartate kinase [[Clostridium] leptum]BCI60681.1 aspartokinase [Solibaculum mannosilyticum]CZT57724.1 Aspartokinase [Eubacteriaceae bacterium CHKCI005]